MGEIGHNVSNNDRHIVEHKKIRHTTKETQKGHTHMSTILNNDNNVQNKLESNIIKPMKLEYAYNVSYTSQRRVKKYSRKLVNMYHNFTTLQPFMSKDVPHITRYEIDFIVLLHCAKQGLQLSDEMHYGIFNYATSVTLKGLRKLANLQGNMTTFVQDCDMVEIRNTAYASIVEAYKQGQFLTIANQFQTALNEYRQATSDFRTSTDTLVENVETLQQIITSLRKAISTLAYHKVNAYAYRIGRDNRHFSIDAWTEDDEGNEVPIIETVISKHFEMQVVKAQVNNIIESMDSKQVQAIKDALKDNHAKIQRYFNCLNKRLHDIELSETDARFMQRVTLKVRETYHNNKED